MHKNKKVSFTYIKIGPNRLLLLFSDFGVFVTSILVSFFPFLLFPTQEYSVHMHVPTWKTQLNELVTVTFGMTDSYSLLKAAIQLFC